LQKYRYQPSDYQLDEDKQNRIILRINRIVPRIFLGLQRTQDVQSSHSTSWNSGLKSTTLSKKVILELSASGQ